MLAGVVIWEPNVRRILNALLLLILPGAVATGQIVPGAVAAVWEREVL